MELCCPEESSSGITIAKYPAKIKNPKVRGNLIELRSLDLRSLGLTLARRSNPGINNFLIKNTVMSPAAKMIKDSTKSIKSFSHSQLINRYNCIVSAIFQKAYTEFISLR